GGSLAPLSDRDAPVRQSDKPDRLGALGGGEAGNRGPVLRVGVGLPQQEGHPDESGRAGERGGVDDPGVVRGPRRHPPRDARARSSKGTTQLEGHPSNAIVASHQKGKLISGAGQSVDAKGAVIAMGGDVEGYLRASEISRDRVEDARTHLKEGDSVTAMIINVDRKNRTINLSVKQKEFAEENEAMAKLQSESAASTGSTNLGALLKAKLDNKNAQQ